MASRLQSMRRRNTMVDRRLTVFDSTAPCDARRGTGVLSTSPASDVRPAHSDHSELEFSSYDP